MSDNRLFHVYALYFRQSCYGILGTPLLPVSSRCKNNPTFHVYTLDRTCHGTLNTPRWAPHIHTFYDHARCHDSTSYVILGTLSFLLCLSLLAVLLSFFLIKQVTFLLPEMAMVDKGERRGATITALTSTLTRDPEIRLALNALQLNDRGHAATRLPFEVTQKIVKLVHGQEHRDCMASVFAEMRALPKCQACGSVSEHLVLISFLPHRPTKMPLFLFCSTAQTLRVPSPHHDQIGAPRYLFCAAIPSSSPFEILILFLF